MSKKIPIARNWYVFDAVQACSLGLALVGVALFVFAAPWAPGAMDRWLTQVLLGFSGNLITGAITAFVVDTLAQRQTQQERLRSLVLDVISRDPSLSRRAVKELNEHGWLRDGTMAGQDLSYVQLEGVDLEGADLTGAQMKGAVFNRCNLRRVKLAGADLEASTFSRCDLSKADLTKVTARLSDWTDSDLRGAELTDGKFLDSNFLRADLTDAKLAGADTAGSSFTDARGAGLT